MTDITIRSDMGVRLASNTGSDLEIAQSAWVSTDREGEEGEVPGLINYLMKHRHGTPFEDGYLKFLAEVPIFVAREWMRHRIGWSYSEVSGRYATLKPVFWHPGSGRGIVNEGTSARPKMAPAPDVYPNLAKGFVSSYKESWEWYEAMLEVGIANEVARSVLPVGTYTRFFARCNPRSLMHFLSLRVKSGDAAYATYPQAEIQEAAEMMEGEFARLFPITYSAFVQNGRVAP